MFDATETRPPLRVLVLHNRYKERGGEDMVFERETQLLRLSGCTVETYEVHNDETDTWSVLDRAVNPVWNKAQYRAVEKITEIFRPDIVHVHNFYAVLSPAIYYAARASGAAVVQTMHNFRVGCANGLLYRDGEVCETCIGRTFAWPGILHRCYRQSRNASLSVAAMTATHRLMGTWQSAVDVYITMTNFTRSILVKAGIPADRLVVKPHFTPEPLAIGSPERRKGVLFVGRLSPEKGIDVMLRAWRRSSIPLRIIGDGPLSREIPLDNPVIEFLGRRQAPEVATAMAEAAFLIMPSLWYETFGMVVIEAFAAGLPVLASRLGAMAELVEDGETGWLFRPGDADDLAAKLEQAFAQPKALAHMSLKARAAYRARYTPEQGYRELMAIYNRAIARRRAASPSR